MMDNFIETLASSLGFGVLADSLGIDPAWLLLALIWALAWKGVALWKSAGLKQKYWFIAILLINTLGILEIVYILFVARRYKVEVIEKVDDN